MKFGYEVEHSEIEPKGDGTVCELKISNLFEKFFNRRFGEDRHESYKEEWKERFKHPDLMSFMDPESKEVFLHVLMTEMYRRPAKAQEVKVRFGK